MPADSPAPSYAFKIQFAHSDRERVEFLFELYEQLTAPRTAGLDKKPKRKRKTGELE
jgi:hypothetical protein